MSTIVTKVVLIFLIVLGVQNVIAAPRYRIKRVSDNHLADLETRVALSKVKGMAITAPVGIGLVDPLKIGRRRRAQSRVLDVLFNQSEEDNGDPIEIDYEILQRLRQLP